MGELDPRVSAQEEAEKTFEAFMLWLKRVTMYSAIFLGIVVFGCNSGVEQVKVRLALNIMENSMILTILIRMSK